MKTFSKLLAMLLIGTNAHGQSPATIPNNTLALGKTGAANKIIEFNLTKAGATTNPRFRWNNGSSFFDLSNDGTTFSRISRYSDKLSVFAATSSSELAEVLSDETGSGSVVYSTSPTLVTPILGAATATSLSSGSVTITGSYFLSESTDSSTTGSAAALTVTTPSTVLTNASLASIGSITSPTTGKNLTIVNRTGASVSVLDEDTGSTAANRILTGTGANLTLANNASILVLYSSSDSRWHVVGGTGSGSGGSTDNKLTNGGFESGTPGWTASGGTFTTTTTAANVFEGTTAGSWDSNSAAQTLTGTAITVGGLAGTNAELTCMIQVPSGTATHTLGVWDGSTLSSDVTINSSSTYAATTINFVVPASGTITPRITSMNADEPLIHPDDCYVGKPRNVVNAAPQARLMGTAVITGCSSSFSRGFTTSTFGAMTGGSVPTGCLWAVTGSATAPSGTARPAFTFSSLPVGDYRIEYEGAVTTRAITASVNDGFFQFTDGTITARETSMATSPGSTANSGHSTISQSFSYTSPQSNKTWEIYAKGTGTTGDDEYISGTTARPGVLRLWYYPPVGQQAVSSAQADYSGSTYTLTSSNTQGFGTPTSASCTHDRVGGNLLLNCKLTTGTVTASEARINLPNSLVSADTTRIPSLTALGSLVQGSNAGALATYVLIEPSVGYVTFGLQNAGTSGLNKANASAFSTSSNPLSFSVSVPIQGWSSNQRAPTLVGSVTSNSTNAIRDESAYITNSGTPAISSQLNGNWIASLTDNGTGDTTLTLVSGAFTTAPICTCSGQSDSTDPRICKIRTSTTSAVRVLTSNEIDGGTSVDVDLNIHCKGSR